VFRLYELFVSQDDQYLRITYGAIWEGTGEPPPGHHRDLIQLVNESTGEPAGYFYANAGTLESDLSYRIDHYDPTTVDPGRYAVLWTWDCDNRSGSLDANETVNLA
jgi:hypothetical protein